MSIVPSPPANATPTARGLMSAADKAKLDGLSASPVSAVTQANGLTLTTGTLAMGAAGAASAGAVTTGAQEFGGAKTLTGAILNGVTTIAEAVTSLVRAVGASLVLRSSLGAGASDVAVKVGTSETDAGTNAAAELFRISTGLGGTEVSKLAVLKGGTIVNNGVLRSTSSASVYVYVDSGAARLIYGATQFEVLSSAFRFYDGSAYSLAGNATQLTIGRLVQLNSLGAAKPAASSTTRGMLWYSKSANGVADTIEVCLKSAGDTYAWVTLATG